MTGVPERRHPLHPTVLGLSVDSGFDTDTGYETDITEGDADMAIYEDNDGDKDMILVISPSSSPLISIL